MKTTSQTITIIIIIISYINLNVRLQQYFLLHSFHFIPQSLLGYWSYGHCYNGVSQEKEEEEKTLRFFYAIDLTRIARSSTLLLSSAFLSFCFALSCFLARSLSLSLCVCGFFKQYLHVHIWHHHPVLSRHIHVSSLKFVTNCSARLWCTNDYAVCVYWHCLVFCYGFIEPN